MFELGRRYAPDSQDANFPMKLVLPQKVDLTYRYWWAYRVHLDQTGDTCVANAWTHFLTDSPRTHTLINLDNQQGTAFADDQGKWSPNYVSAQSQEKGFRGWLYDKAQAIDEWADTPPEGGTSVRAGVKALQTLGAVQTYHWAQTLDDVINAVLTTGPVVVGTEWYQNMFWLEPKYTLKVDMSSGLAGGHAWVLDGVNKNTGYFRMKNSWGTGWGNNGFARISFHDVNTLLFDRDGEGCIALEP